jgi:hypothetical protein
VLILGDLEHPPDSPRHVRTMRADEHPRVHPTCTAARADTVMIRVTRWLPARCSRWSAWESCIVLSGRAKAQ